MIVLVAEKPSVATQHYRSMLERCAGERFEQREGYLEGKEHCITWCVGHLITLAPLDQYPGFEGPWQLKNLPMLPQKFLLEPIERTKRQLQIVQGLMQRATVLVNGADAGREGNLIFDLVVDYTPELRKKDIRRLWVNSYVAKELDIAWKNLEKAEQRIHLSYAARLRQRADWMVGLNATRAYTLTAGRGKLISVGRVQTPTLNLIVQRDQQVENFREHHYYGVLGTWNGFITQWLREDKVAWFDESKIPQTIVDQCNGQIGTLQDLDIRKKSQFPPKPFDLTELQKEANKRFKINVQQVLDIAQVLYEKKLITYPRTDSAYLPESMLHESHRLALALASPRQKELLRPVTENFLFVNSEKVTDHYAIIPTGEAAVTLPGMEQQIYDLVVERFIQAWLQPYIWSEFQARILCAEENFRLKLRKAEQEGFRSIVKEENKSRKGKKNAENSDDEIENEVNEFPDWHTGQTAPLDPVELHRKKKTKPKYYTEATLLAAMKTAGRQIEDEDMAEAMKDRGLGTPATQAGIIETLKKRGFVEARKNNLVSTARGRQVISLMDEKIKSPEMTGEWEYKLSLVEKGNYDPVAFRDGIVTYVQQLFSHLQQKFSNQFQRELVTEPLNCPCCAQPLTMPPWGYTCDTMGCGFRIGHTVAQRALSHEEMRELLQQRHTGILNGFVSRKGSSFSAKLLLDSDNAIQFDFENAEHPPEPCAGKCPQCASSLLDHGNRLACAKECGWALYKTVAGKALSPENLQALLSTGRTPLLDGFTSRKGTSFSAYILCDTQGKTRFEFPRTQFHCPRCGSPMRKVRTHLECELASCGLQIPRIIHSVNLEDPVLQELLQHRHTRVISGFIKNNTAFQASLIVRDDFRIAFDRESVKVLPLTPREK